MEKIQPFKEDRPWGNFVEFTLNTPSTVKIITVNPAQAFSLQTHEHRSEFWKVLSGVGMVTAGDSTKEAKAGDEFWLPQGTQHRIEAHTDVPIVILEIALGVFDENDITRLQDNYGRVAP